ncbi:MAG: AsmA family protein [Elusimicrobia bacterium]|nr:AsmA family protein [Elusimicrobiota bacterium]
MKLFRQILLRIIFLPLVFAVLFLATGALIINTMFTSRNLEALVADQLQQIFKRSVSIQSARLSLAGIKIKGLNVIEPGPQAVNFITADYIDATYRLLPLLQKSLVLDSIVLVSPRIELIKKAEGGWNFSDILAAYRQSTARKNVLHKIDAAEIKDGLVNITNPGAETGCSFENVNLTVKDFKPGSDTPFNLSAFFKRKNPARYLEGRFYGEGAVNLGDFDLNLAVVNDLSLNVSVSGRSLSVKGRIKNFRRPEIELTAGVAPVSAKELAPLFKSAYDFRLPATVWDLKAEMSEDRKLTFAARVDPLKATAEGFLKFESSSTVYDLIVYAPPFELTDFNRLTRVPFVEEARGKAQVRLNINNKSGKFNLSKIFLNLDKTELKYRNLRFTGLTLAALLSESFKNNYLNATEGALLLGSSALTGFRLKMEFGREKLIADYSARWGGAPLKGTLSVSNPLSDKKTGRLTGYSKKLDVKAWRDLLIELKKVKLPDKNRKFYNSGLAWLKTVKNSIPAGFASFKLLYKADSIKHEYFDAAGFYLWANLRGITGRIENLGGDFSIKSGKGVFYDVQKTSERDRIYYIFSLPVLTLYRLNRMGALKFGYKLNDVNFNSIGGNYSFDSGKVKIRDFFMDGKEFSMYTTGTADLSAETINLKVYTISDKYYSMGGLPEALTDASGKPALAFTIEGRMNKPVINMISPKEAGAIIDGAIKKGVEIDLEKADKFAGGTK